MHGVRRAVASAALGGAATACLAGPPVRRGEAKPLPDTLARSHPCGPTRLWHVCPHLSVHLACRRVRQAHRARQVRSSARRPGLTTDGGLPEPGVRRSATSATIIQQYVERRTRQQPHDTRRPSHQEMGHEDRDAIERTPLAAWAFMRPGRQGPLGTASFLLSSCAAAPGTSHPRGYACQCAWPDT